MAGQRLRGSRFERSLSIRREVGFTLHTIEGTVRLWLLHAGQVVRGDMVVFLAVCQRGVCAVRDRLSSSLPLRHPFVAGGQVHWRAGRVTSLEQRCTPSPLGSKACLPLGAPRRRSFLTQRTTKIRATYDDAKFQLQGPCGVLLWRTAAVRRMGKIGCA